MRLMGSIFRIIRKAKNLIFKLRTPNQRGQSLDHLKNLADILRYASQIASNLADLGESRFSIDDIVAGVFPNADKSRRKPVWKTEDKGIRRKSLRK